MAVALTRMDSLERSGAFSAETLNRFRDYLETAPDEALYRVNPLDFAEAHGLAPREAIDLFVRASHAGLFDFTWTVICPSCGFNISAHHALRQLHEQSRCVMCEIDVEVSLDEVVEVSFTISPAVRSIRFHQPEQFSWGPDLDRVIASANRIIHPELKRAIMEGMRVLAVLPRGGSAREEAVLETGIFRAISNSHHLATRLDVEGEPTNEPQVLRIEFRPEGVRLEPTVVRPGPVQMEVRNLTEDFQAWSLVKKPPFCPSSIASELATRFRPFLTGKRLLTSQAFRDLYRTESLIPGASLTLRSLTILFTDLKGSTEMYDRIGDLNAYRLVRAHFDILATAVAEHDGAIVKTIGDAIMATFPDPARALEATIQMHQRLATWNRSHESDDLTLKIGIHEGPCIAVDSNDRLDYFGQTVNMAARIQGLAESQETYFSETVHASPAVAEVIARHGMKLTPRTAHLKGISEDVQVYRAAFA